MDGPPYGPSPIPISSPSGCASTVKSANTWKPTVTTTRCLTSSRAEGGRRLPATRSRSSPRPSASPARAQVRALPTQHDPRAYARVHRRHAQWTPSRHRGLGRRRPGPNAASSSEEILPTRPHPASRGSAPLLGISAWARPGSAPSGPNGCGTRPRPAVVLLSLGGIDPSTPSTDQPLRSQASSVLIPVTAMCAVSHYYRERRRSCCRTPPLRGLRTLKLDVMAQGLIEQREQSRLPGTGLEERLGLLVDREVAERENRRLQRYLQVGQATRRGHRRGH